MRCPTPGQLDHFLNGRLAGPDHEAVGAHINACPACQRVLDVLTSDVLRFAARLRQPLTGDFPVPLADCAPAADDTIPPTHPKP